MNSFESNLDKILTKYDDLEKRISSSEISTDQLISLSKERSSLEDLVLQIKSYKKLLSYIEDCEVIILNKDSERELIEMAEEELLTHKKNLPEILNKLKRSLLPKDEADERNAILEIRAGTGGDEAALFAGDLLNMYLKYAEIKGWKTEIFSLSDSESGGYKEASIIIKGQNVFANLKYESGVHRVQRIPDTESSGRIHTSAATVAVLPEAKDVDIKINDADLRIDTYRASGAGGQHINTTDSAVRVTHIPTGLVTQCQSGRSQHKNKAEALRMMKAKLYDYERQKEEKKMASTRKSQIGSGDRSERIRTYNFPQNRVTDHRINLTLYKIEEIVKFGMLNELIEALISYDESQKISNIE